MPPTELNVQRVRHPLKMRLLEVKRVTRPTPHLARITLAGDALRDFVSASFDDHVKVFFPPPGAARPVLPELGPDGLVFAEGEPRPPMRDYTPRRHDARDRGRRPRGPAGAVDPRAGQRAMAAARAG
ncbi:siderophore-interacting protein, partial [Bordetella pertussis]|uniref:siderophore-interacting protein n=1 Tax=Bordetella pertussis TaxID=520 RepID=UPI000A867CAD